MAKAGAVANTAKVSSSKERSDATTKTSAKRNSTSKFDVMAKAGAVANTAKVSSSKERSDSTTKTSAKRNSSPKSVVMTKVEAVANPAQASSSTARSDATTKTSAKRNSSSKSATMTKDATVANPPQVSSSKARSASQEIFSMISQNKFEEMWTLFSELESRRALSTIPSKSEIFDRVIDQSMELCTGKINDEKKQLESFKKYFNFLTSERFSKNQHDKWIALLKGRLQDSQGGLAVKCFDIISEYVLESLKQTKSDEIKGMKLQISSIIKDNNAKTEQLTNTYQQMNEKPI
eukprot:1029897_1